MVFFVCGGCGGSFKRKQADQHTFRCRNWAFSCMDCNKDFPGQSYVQHTQCITESEKYFGSHHVAKVGKDKNEVWMNRLRERLAAQTGLKPYIVGLVTRILSYPNIPRKQSKFENFLKTSMNMSYKPTVDELWRLVSEAGEGSNKENNTANGLDSSPAIQQHGKEGEEDARPDGDAKLDKKKKRKLDKNAVEESEETANFSGDSELKTKKKRKTVNVEEEVSTEANCEQEEESDESNVKESKSARRRRRKQQQSATEEPDPLAPVRRGMNLDPEEQERDFADYEDISVDTVVGEKNFKWRRTLKKLIREGPSDGIKVAKLLNKIVQLHNDPLAGASQPLPKDTLQTILMKMLARKPFSIVDGKATIGKAGKK